MRKRPVALILLVAASFVAAAGTLPRSFHQPTANATLAAKKAQALSNIKQINWATALYLGDYDDLFSASKTAKGVGDAIDPYLKNRKLMKSLNPSGGRLLFNTHLGGVSATALEVPARIVTWYDSKAWPDATLLVGLADGQACWATSHDWKATYAPTLKAHYPHNSK